MSRDDCRQEILECLATGTCSLQDIRTRMAPRKYSIRNLRYWMKKMVQSGEVVGVRDLKLDMRVIRYRLAGLPK